VPAQFVGAETGYIAFDTLQDLGEEERYNALSLAFSDPNITWAEASTRAADIRETIFDSAGLRVLFTDVPKPGSHFLGDIFKAVSLLLLALGVLALGLSAFLVVNTVSALMAQQVRQVGIMKAIGGSAGQLETLYVVTVASYGVLAVAIGLPAAAAGSRWFTDYAAEILNFRVADYTLPAWVVGVEIAVGLLVPLLAAAVPVRQGTRMTVVRALNTTGMDATHFGHRWTDRLLSAIRGLPRPVALSLRNTFLRKGRLALTLSTLVLASAVVVSVFSVRASIERTISDLESWWRYDAQLAFALPQDATKVEDAVAAVAGVKATETWTSSLTTTVTGGAPNNPSASTSQPAVASTA
jgi:putative ABC transport system permease protein